MSTESPAETGSKVGLEQVKLLFDYTKFHIGLYTGVITVLVAGLNLRSTLRWPVEPTWLGISIIFIAVAGLAGGVIASSLPHFSTIGAFWDAEIGPFRSRLFRGETWTYIEHTAFWIGVISGLVALLR